MGVAGSQEAAALGMAHDGKAVKLHLHRQVPDTLGADLKKEKSDMHLAL